LNLYQKADVQHDELKLLVERRQDLKQMLTQEKNRFQAPLNKSLQCGIKAVIDCLEQQVKINKQNNLKQPNIISKKRCIADRTGHRSRYRKYLASISA